MPRYEIELPEGGRYEVESDTELSDEEVEHQARLSISEQEGYGAGAIRGMKEGLTTPLGLEKYGRAAGEAVGGDIGGTMGGGMAAGADFLIRLLGLPGYAAREPMEKVGREKLADPRGKMQVSTGMEEAMGHEPVEITPEQYGLGGALITDIAADPVIALGAARKLGRAKTVAGEAADVGEAAARAGAPGTSQVGPEGVPLISGTPKAPGEELIIGKTANQVSEMTDPVTGLRYADRARRTPHEETMDLAERFGMDIDDLHPALAGNPHEIFAVRTQLDELAQKSRQAAQEFAQTRSPGALTKLDEVRFAFEELRIKTKGLKGEAGKALDQFNIPTSKNERINIEIAERLMDMDDPKAIAKFLEGVGDMVNKKLIGRSKWGKIKDGIHEAWINGLLSGPKTHMVNFTSNVLTAFTRPAQTAVAATLEAAATLGGVRRGRQVFYREVLSDLAGMTKGFSEGVEAATKSFKSGRPEFGLGKLEIRSALREGAAKRGKVARGAAAVATSPGRALVAADDFFKAINFRGRVNALAYREGQKALRTGKITAEQLPEYINELATITSQGKYANKARQLQKQGIEEAVYRTFQKELGTGKGPWATAEKTLETWRNLPGGRYVVPFLRTPMNIAKFGLEHTPLGFIGKFRKMARGEIRGAAVMEEMARPVMGSLMAVAVHEGVTEGLITGGGPADPQERSTWYSTGWLPYSVWDPFNNQYISYSRLEPLGMVMGLLADYVELGDIVEVEDAASKVAQAFGNNLSSKTFLKGVNQLVRVLQDPERNWNDYFARQLGTAVPTGVAQFSFASDPYLRDPESETAMGGAEEVFQTRTFQGETVAPYRDIWGQPVVYQEGGFLEKLISPFRRSYATDDPASLELKRLRYGPGSPRRNLGTGENRVRLTGQRYDRYVELSGGYAKQAVLKLMATAEYKRANDDEKILKIKRAFTEGRKRAVSQLGREYEGVPRQRRTRGDIRRRLRRRRRSR